MDATVTMYIRSMSAERYYYFKISLTDIIILTSFTFSKEWMKMKEMPSSNAPNYCLIIMDWLTTS